MLKRTPLYTSHQKLGARLVEFGGWEMPVQYSSIMDEHLAVRSAAGLFDISHMGEVRVVGEAARDFLNSVLTNDLRKLSAGQAQYTLMCNERGGVVDDLYAYCLAAREFLLMINASRIDGDVAWLKQELERFPQRGGVQLENVSDFLSAVAVQGPRVADFINEVLPGKSTGGTVVERATDLRKNQIAGFRWDGALMWVARTGYTGEDGFEIIAPNSVIEAVWNKVLGAGQPHGLKPAGLGARDTLRTEMCYPLYGHELDEQTTPIEAGLGFFVALDKGEFTGRAVLAEQKAKGTSKKCGLQAHRQVGPTASALPDLEHGRLSGEDRRGRERHAESFAEPGHWPRLRAAGIRQSRHPDRDRGARVAIPGHRGPQADLPEGCRVSVRPASRRQ
jgi:aminomethyltransferase